MFRTFEVTELLQSYRAVTELQSCIVTYKFFGPNGKTGSTVSHRDKIEPVFHCVQEIYKLQLCYRFTEEKKIHDMYWERF